MTPGLLALLAADAAISSTSCRSIRARSLNFVGRSTKPSPAYADNRQVIHPMIQGAIARNLSARGVSQVASGGDLTVAYLAIVGNNATTTAINDYFGYGGDTAALQDKAHTAYTSSKNPSYFEAGTLVIDLIDSKTFRLLKRGHASRPILRNLPDDARVARIQEVVDEILRDLRVATGG